MYLAVDITSLEFFMYLAVDITSLEFFMYLAVDIIPHFKVSTQSVAKLTKNIHAAENIQPQKGIQVFPQCISSVLFFHVEAIYSGIFYSCQFIRSFWPFHSFWEEEDLSWEINTSFTEWHHYHIMSIQFHGHPANSAVAYL